MEEPIVAETKTVQDPLRSEAPHQDTVVCGVSGSEAPREVLKPFNQTKTKVELKVNLNGEKNMTKAMKALCAVEGVESVSRGMDQKLTVVGGMDPVDVVNKLRKLCSAQILSVVPVEEKKKEEPKMDEKKKDVTELMNAYLAYNPYSPVFLPRSEEEGRDPNACALC